jgi:hypothetical protein
MKFLIKAAFWLGIVVIFLPMPESERSKSSPGVSTVDAIAFLSTAVSDIKGFCSRNPDSCVTGAKAVQHFGEKAEYGAKILHEFISAKMDESKDLSVPKGSLAKPAINQTKQASPNQTSSNHGTLNPSDLEPAWHAPKTANSQS